MKVHLTDLFLRSYQKAPLRIQESFERKSDLLVQNLRYPSLRAKKYDETKDIWQARINDDWRFYFQIKGDTYYMIDIMLHPK